MYVLLKATLLEVLEISDFIELGRNIFVFDKNR